MTAGFGFGAAIPTLPLLDEGEARAFYVDYLGFEVDWEHRFHDTPTSPLYMQVRLGSAILHLDGHADELASPVELRIPVRNLDDYCEHLRSKNSPYERPRVVDPRYTGRNTDMTVVDPFDNVIVFWSQLDFGEDVALGGFYTRPFLFVDDVQASVGYFCDRLGFSRSWGGGDENRDLAQVGRDGLEVFLASGRIEPSPGRPAVLSMALRQPQLLDELYQEFVTSNARIVSPPAPVTWQAGTRQMQVEDLDGNLLLFWGEGSPG